MKIQPLKKIQKFHLERPYMCACPPLNVGSFIITINKKIEIWGHMSPRSNFESQLQKHGISATTFKMNGENMVL
jgi:hypothetical protein